MAVEPAAPRTPRPCGTSDGLRRHLHERPARPRRRDAGAGGGRRPHRRQHRARLLGADDHALDPRRPRGRPAGRGGRRRARRRDRDPDQGHRGHLDRHRVRQRRLAGGQLQRRPVLRARLPELRRGVPRDAPRGHRPGRRALRRVRRGRHAVQVHERLHDRLRPRPQRRRHAATRGGRADRARGGPLRRAARELGPEPDPRVRAARPGRPGRAAAARSWASSARRRPRRCRTRTTPATSAASWSARRTRTR